MKKALLVLSIGFMFSYCDTPSETTGTSTSTSTERSSTNSTTTGTDSLNRPNNPR